MKTGKIVLVDNMAGVSSLVNSLQKNTGMGLIYGRWGLGKTTALDWLCTNVPSFKAIALAIWESSRTTMIEDILACYRVESRGRLKTDFRELVRIAAKHGLPLIIDEADRVARRYALIEIIRDLHDLARIPIILVGSENLLGLLQRADLGPVFSRITELFEFRELSAADVKRISLELCDLECSDKVAGYIRTLTLGDFRLLKAFLLKAEQIAAYQETTEITIPIAEAASSAVAFREELMVARGRRVALPDETVQPLRVAG
jgi:DNA transposition AAA+ family ATPase